MKNIKYLIFTFVIAICFIVSVNALTDSDLTISKNNKRVSVSYSDSFETLNDAKAKIIEFKKYISDKNGVLEVAKIDTIINSVDNEILTNSFDVDNLNDIDAKRQELQDEFDAQATDEVSCEVVLGEVETIETPFVDYEDESGVIGEYTNERTARMIAFMVQMYNNRPDYRMNTSVSVESRVVDTEVLTLNEIHRTQMGAWFRRFVLANQGYDVSGVNVEQCIVTDTTYETQEFTSVDAKVEATSVDLENQGYRVTDTLLAIDQREEEVDALDIDENFTSIADLNAYLSNLQANYNNVNTNITDNSTFTTSNGHVEEDGFTSSDEANDYLDSLDSQYDLVYNKNVSSYTSNEEETENVKKYFLTEAEGNTYLTDLENSFTGNESLENKNVRKLSIDEIDMDTVINTGDTGLDSADYQYTYLGIDSNNTSNFNRLALNIDGTNRNGRITSISSVTVDGVEALDVGGIFGYSFRINNGNINNNSKIIITGTISYSYRQGFSYRTETINFTAQGILNRGYDNSRNRNTFEYSIDGVTVNNGEVVVNDNLVDIYEASATKKSLREVTLYKATADTYKKEKVESYNLTGTASNKIYTPIMRVQFTLEKDRTVYNLVGDATRDIYRNFYIVNYRARRTIRGVNTTYRQNYSVIETVNTPEYIATGLGYYDEAEEIVAVPSTGIKETFDYTYILLIISSVVIGLSTKLAYKKNN